MLAAGKSKLCVTLTVEVAVLGEQWRRVTWVGQSDSEKEISGVVAPLLPSDSALLEW